MRAREAKCVVKSLWPDTRVRLRESRVAGSQAFFRLSVEGKLVSASLTAKTAVTCLSYSMILADMASQLTGASRTRALLGVTLSGLLPLCALDTSKTFGLLKYSSALGLAATAFVTFVIGFPHRSIQCVLKKFPRAGDVLTSFDLDCCGFAYDGTA